MIRLTENDPWLKPYEERIQKRREFTERRERAITEGGLLSLTDFANGHKYYGMHHEEGRWTLREFLPAAKQVYLIGSFNNWESHHVWQLSRVDDYGNWEIQVSDKVVHPGDHYRLFVHWDGGCGERVPAWATRVVQDPITGIFSAQVWDSQYEWKYDSPKPADAPLLIYEAHIGMSSELAQVSSYTEFREQVLPRIHALGYNTLQLMAIQEHPYYGSFGYHVSSFFAPTSRFGTPEELKALIDAAHGLGIRVIMDLVHSHAVKNEVEGLARYDGSRTLFFHEGNRGEHPAWDSLCFDYGRNNVIHFLLSNCKYWLEEYKFDGFRFDGVSSMLYYNHGLGESFTSYADYFNGHQDADAMAYLALANKLIHQINPNAVTIAEEVSGMPGLAAPIEDGGFGFDYRLAMNIPDYWIQTIVEKSDEQWSPGDIWYQLTNRRKDEKTISYAESHDQALVGDKTLIFRLADADMYEHMSRLFRSIPTDRAVALHKMIRLITLSTMSGGYLSFMGNEFGHPEWVDFPRQGNDWSYQYARRQWSLVDNKDLLYSDLNEFDRAMLALVKGEKGFDSLPLVQLWSDEEAQVLAYQRGNLYFLFNFSPTISQVDYAVPVPEGSYAIALNTDSPEYGGYGHIDEDLAHQTIPCDSKTMVCKGDIELKVYLPARTALVLRKL